MKTLVGWFARSVVAMIALSASGPASAALQGPAGPVSADNGFPLYYRDLSGLNLGLCLDENGFCALLADANFNPANPVVFPTNFPLESFYWVADASVPTAGGAGNDAILSLALEATFAPSVAAGNQVTFLRINLKKMSGLPPNQTYTVTHPFGTFQFSTDNNGDTVPGVGNQAYRAQEGCAATPCDFDALIPATSTGIGPFLVAASGLVTSGGNTYVGDGVTPVPVTGPGVINNFFRIDGPDIGGSGVSSVQTNDFVLAGKVIGLHVSPATADFGPWNLSATSLAKGPFTVTNLNSASVTLNAVSSSDASFVLPAASDHCSGTTLAAAATCTFMAEFAPTLDGAATGQLTVSAPGSASTLVRLSGRGDSIAPSLTLGPLVTPTKQTSQTISGAVEAGANVEVSVNGAAPVPAGVVGTNWSFDVALGQEGQNDAAVTALDSALPLANATTLHALITRDTTAPALGFDAVTSPTTRRTQLITGTVETGATVTVSANNSAAAPASVVAGAWSFNVTGLLAGDNSVAATARDAVGNATTKLATMHVDIPDGDLGGQAGLDLVDALLALQIALDVTSPTATDLLHGDVCPIVAGTPAPDGKIDRTDAVAILEKHLGLMSF